jgi:hypothetical protein
MDRFWVVAALREKLRGQGKWEDCHDGYDSLPFQP